MNTSIVKSLKNEGALYSYFLIVLSLFGNRFTSPKILLLLVAVLFNRNLGASKHVDVNFLFLFLFLLVYVLNINIFGDGLQDFGAQVLMFPCLLYILGKRLGKRLVSGRQFIFVIASVGFSLGIFVLISVFSNIVDNGFSGNTRSLKLVGEVGDAEINATGLAGYLTLMDALAGILIAVILNRLSFNIIVFMCALVFLSFVVALRLGSRTHLAIIAISLVIGLLVNRKYIKAKYKFIIFSSIVVAYLFLHDLFENYLSLFEYFQDRINDDDASAASVGGRMDHWLNSLDLMVSNPTGWGLNSAGYAHNLWLDAAREGGWLAFILGIVFSVVSVSSVAKSIRRHNGDMLFVTSAVCSLFSFYAVFFVEPILNGLIYAFSAHCAVLGMLCGYGGDSSGLRINRGT